MIEVLVLSAALVIGYLIGRKRAVHVEASMIAAKIDAHAAKLTIEFQYEERAIALEKFAELLVDPKYRGVSGETAARVAENLAMSFRLKAGEANA